MSDDNPILAIIGTAGRGDDGAKLHIDKWNDTKRVVLKLIEDYGITSLISGGAAFADHLAVQAFLSPKVHVNKLTLCLPCEFNLSKGKFQENPKDQKDCGRISNWYHEKSMKITGRDSLAEIAQAIEGGAEVIVGKGFFDRNKTVARWADMLVAITFGTEEWVKDGGTAHTTREFIKLKKSNDNAFHIDLNEVKLYKKAIV